VLAVAQLRMYAKPEGNVGNNKAEGGTLETTQGLASPQTGKLLIIGIGEAEIDIVDRGFEFDEALWQHVVRRRVVRADDEVAVPVDGAAVVLAGGGGGLVRDSLDEGAEVGVVGVEAARQVHDDNALAVVHVGAVRHGLLAVDGRHEGVVEVLDLFDERGLAVLGGLRPDVDDLADDGVSAQQGEHLLLVSQGSEVGHFVLGEGCRLGGEELLHVGRRAPDAPLEILVVVH